MRTPPFKEVSGLERTSHGALGLALAGEFGEVDLVAAEQGIARRSAALAHAAHLEPEAQLQAAGHAFRGTLVARFVREDGRFGDLHLDRVLEHGRGHPLVCAIAGIECARWAGVPLGLVASAKGIYVGRPRAESTLLLDPAGGWRLVDARTLNDPDLAWHCPHEAAGRVLALIGARAERTGLLPVRLRAAELALSLPLCDEPLDALRTDLAHVRARLN